MTHDFQNPPRLRQSRIAHKRLDIAATVFGFDEVGYVRQGTPPVDPIEGEGGEVARAGSA
jgi:hypothetical protein